MPVILYIINWLYIGNTINNITYSINIQCTLNYNVLEFKIISFYKLLHENVDILCLFLDESSC